MPVGVQGVQAWDRYAYVNNSPILYSDPSGHCAISSSAFINPLGIFSFYASCVENVVDAYNAYQDGETSIGVLYLEATGLKDLIVDIADHVHQMNKDVSTVFSYAPFSERIMPSVRVGSFAVGTAANITAAGQAIRGVKAFTRTGSGGDSYFVKATKAIRTFEPGDTLYRVYGGEARQAGSWAFTRSPGNQINAIRKGALPPPPKNTTQYMTKVSFTGPVKAEVSRVAHLFGQPGGYTQVRLPYTPQGPNSWTFSAGNKLPCGFMPLVPMKFIID